MIHNRSYLGAATILFATVAFVCGARAEDSDGPPIAAATPESSGVEWGAESNGIRCRVTAISATTDDEAPDLTAAVDSFATGDDVTFGVELQNVGDKPATILGVRFNDAYPDVAGKLNASELGPRWVEFEFSDGEGKPIVRASRKVANGDLMGLNDASAHGIAPGESLVFALRPARFDKPFRYRLAPGDYRLRVTYRGPSDEALKRIQKLWPDRSQAGVWTGEVASNSVAFSVAGGPPTTRPADLHWGQAEDGLRAAVELRPRYTAGAPKDHADAVALNSVVEFALHLENVGKRPLLLLVEARTGEFIGLSPVTGRVEGHWGRSQASATTGIPTVIEWTLQPGQTAEISTSRCAVVSTEAPAARLIRSVGNVVVLTPGEHRVRYTIQLGGFELGSRRSDWRGELVTGATPFVVR